ncbi:MAG TPA: hypothetical protein VNE00_18385 [Paraburkholderia sp.]|jgi:hypothetical protein|nr:hypothetical protein [Paraburkholderia sp.]
MKKLSLLVALSTIFLSAPIASFAQGSDMSADGATVHATQPQTAGASAQAATDSYGGTTSGSSAAGFHKHAASQACVGPVSYCNIYFGS